MCLPPRAPFTLFLSFQSSLSVRNSKYTLYLVYDPLDLSVMLEGGLHRTQSVNDRKEKRKAHLIYAMKAMSVGKILEAQQAPRLQNEGGAAASCHWGAACIKHVAHSCIAT